MQPDGISYLLVDAGLARSGKAAQVIASEISQSLGFGPTTLKQPSPGSAADKHATATLFKKGSVIALYDDTPDMSGSIDVNALVDTATSLPNGLSLKWNATETPSP